MPAGRPGFYLSVLEEGELDAGDAVVFSERDSQQISVADVWSLFAGEANDPELARQALALPFLPRSWKEAIATRAADISS